ncbi:MAG: DUF5946 family protein [Bacteroidota bacterium]
MQDYREYAEKNGVILNSEGRCQCCGSKTTRGIHECIDIFNLGFESIDYTKPENHAFRFMSVDAHALQHPEIHGRWSNHFHLTRQQLMLELDVSWHYGLSPKLSSYLNRYKLSRPEERLIAPPPLQRGKMTVTDVLDAANDASTCKESILLWSRAVYDEWQKSHKTVALIAEGFCSANQLF